MKSRVDIIEHRIKQFLDPAQKEVCDRIVPCDQVEYGLQYLKYLHMNRHLIHSVRGIQ